MLFEKASGKIETVTTLKLKKKEGRERHGGREGEKSKEDSQYKYNLVSQDSQKSKQMNN